MKKFLIFVFISILFLGCSSKRFYVLDIYEDNISGINQSSEFYLQNYHDMDELYPTQLQYEKIYFGIWQKDLNVSLAKDVFWGYRVYDVSKKLYGTNLRRYGKIFYKNIYDNSNLESFLSVNRCAITTKSTSMRVFPTDRVLFLDPNRAGEGFPFDYIQNSYISSNKPIVVSHFSKDKRWAFVFSSFTSGWIKTESFAFVDKDIVDFYINAKKIQVAINRLNIYDKDKNFITTIRLTTLLPLIYQDENFSYVLIAYKKDYKNGVNFKSVKIDNRYISNAPMRFTKENIARVLDILKGDRYGWGGMYGDRDCSATMRDFFGMFGVFLPRNSFMQSKIGKITSLNGLDDEKKLNLIKTKAIPFETLLYRKGHIALYVGVYNNKVIIFQNMWGIKLKKGDKSGRAVVGKAVFSTLDIGKNLKFKDSSSSFIKKLRSMNLVTH